MFVSRRTNTLSLPSMSLTSWVERNKPAVRYSITLVLLWISCEKVLFLQNHLETRSTFVSAWTAFSGNGSTSTGTCAWQHSWPVNRASWTLHSITISSQGMAVTSRNSCASTPLMLMYTTSICSDASLCKLVSYCLMCVHYTSSDDVTNICCFQTSSVSATMTSSLACRVSATLSYALMVCNSAKMAEAARIWRRPATATARPASWEITASLVSIHSSSYYVL